MKGRTYYCKMLATELVKTNPRLPMLSFTFKNIAFNGENVLSYLRQFVVGIILLA